MRALILLLAAVLPSSVMAQTPAPAPAPSPLLTTAPDTVTYAISYVAVAPASRSAASAAFKQYRDASAKENGAIRVDVFEEIGLPGRFVVVERWATAAAASAHAVAAHTQRLKDALQSIRLTGYDERPYKTLNTSPMPASAGRDAVHIVTHADFIPGGDPLATLRRLAETSRTEKGNVRFDILQSTLRPNHFTIVETWQNQAALDAHGAGAGRQFRDAVLTGTGSPVDERVLKAVE
jgi:quinol monooxygenase YgiN